MQHSRRRGRTARAVASPAWRRTSRNTGSARSTPTCAVLAHADHIPNAPDVRDHDRVATNPIARMIGPASRSGGASGPPRRPPRLARKAGAPRVASETPELDEVQAPRPSEDRRLLTPRKAVLISSCAAMPARHAATHVLPLRSEEHTSELQSLRHLVC